LKDVNEFRKRKESYHYRQEYVMMKILEMNLIYTFLMNFNYIHMSN